MTDQSQANCVSFPATDPTPIFELFRGSYATELLTAAVSHFDVFSRLNGGPRSAKELRDELGLACRPAVVLFTALCAFGLLVRGRNDTVSLSNLALEHLVRGGAFDIRDYLGLAAKSPGVLAMVERLQTNRPVTPKSAGTGTAYTYREGVESAMDQEVSARSLTLALAGRAKIVAPYLAQNVLLGNCRMLLDIGGGTGIYSIACLQRNPQLRAVVWDRPEVLKVATEMAVSYGVADRLECRPGDMFKDSVPEADVMLLSNVLHDWDEPECEALVRRCASALPAGGRLLVHDVFLNDSLDGPLPVALYSAALFCITEGRAYSLAEYRHWLNNAGLNIANIYPTLIHCGVLSATRA